MFRPIIFQNKSWWVPEGNSQLLAVQIDQPEEYHQAVIWKMAKLAEEWGFERALASANHYLQQDGGLPLPQPSDEEQLVEFILQSNSRLAEMVNWNSPEMSESATPESARWALEDQQINWEDFLTDAVIYPKKIYSGSNMESENQLKDLSDALL